MVGCVIFTVTTALTISGASPFEASSCEAIDVLRSGGAQDAVALTITNRGQDPLDIFWFDYHGARIPVATIAPGEQTGSGTYATHAWMVEEAGRCICAFTVGDATEDVVAADGTCAAEGRMTFEAKSAYEAIEVEGWSVLISSRFASEAPDLRAPLLEELAKQLREIAILLPARAVSRLQDIEIWLEVDDAAFPGAVYHPEAGWLAANGMNPDKGRGVQATYNLVGWRDDQPYALLHEFAHAYHDQVLGFDDGDIAAAFEAVARDGRYEAVDYVRGGKLKAYALNNSAEYFAELSEAYFGRNDYAPFDRADLEAFDPAGYAVVEEAWAVE